MDLSGSELYALKKRFVYPQPLFAAEQHLPVGGGLFEILLIRHPRQLQRFLKKPKSAEKIYRNKEDGKYNADYLIVHHL